MHGIANRIRRLTAKRDPYGSNANGGSPWRLVGGFVLTGADVAFLTGATRLEIEEAEYLEIVIRPDDSSYHGLAAEWQTSRTHWVMESKLAFDEGGEIFALSNAIRLHWANELEGHYLIESRLVKG
jgi:hypothetical protein